MTIKKEVFAMLPRLLKEVGASVLISTTLGTQSIIRRRLKDEKHQAGCDLLSYLGRVIN